MNPETTSCSLLPAVTVFLLIALAASAIIILVYRRKYIKTKNSAYTDVFTGCLNESGFLRKLKSLPADKLSLYTLVAMHIPEISHSPISPVFQEYSNLMKQIRSALVSQLGGDEFLGKINHNTFCFLLRNRKHEEISAKLDNISKNIKKSETAQSLLSLTPQFGVYLPSVNDIPSHEMLETVQFASENIIGNNNVFFYDAEESEKENRNYETARSVSRALQTGEFIVYFQPKIRLSDRHIVGVEALIRRRSSRDGLLTPDMFISAADHYHTADLIDNFVFTEVCRTFSRWKKQNRELCPITVNLSFTSMNRISLPDEFFSICSKHDVSPSLIEFDLREDLLRGNMELSRAFIDKLHYYGFRCAVDKFGSDICSMRLLTTMQIDSINLDRSFFVGDNNNRHGRYMVENILKLAAQLHINTTAVGIDNPGQVQYLMQVACDTVQGFYFFKPMPLEKLESEIFENNSLRYIDESENQNSYQKKSVSAYTVPKKNKSIVLFSYNPTEDTIEFSDVFSPVLGDHTIFKNASALFRTTDLIHENDRKDFFSLLYRCQRESGWVENTLRFYLNGGRYEWLEIRMHRDDTAVTSTISGALADMSGWRDEINRWKEKATRDPLTGLFNREHFEQNATALLDQKKYDSAALLFVDVDDFKHVNDNYGHMFGDDVLCFVAKQILGVFRHSDIIARYGGDEFVVFAPAIEQNVLEDRLDKLCKTFQFPYRNGGTELKISVTLGAAVSPRDGADYETLLHHADCALYEAKERGKNQYCIYEPYMKGETSKK